MLEVFAGYIERNVSSGLPCFQMIFENVGSFLNFIQDVKAKSTFVANVEVGADDKIVTLSTCTCEVYNARYILPGKLTLIAGVEPEPESTPEEMGADSATLQGE